MFIDELKESIVLMHTYCAEMTRLKTVNDTAGVLMKERHAQMKQIVSYFMHQVRCCLQLSCEKCVGSCGAVY